MYITRKFPIESENGFSSKTCELLSKLYGFFTLKLDTRDTAEGDVGYHAIQKDGSEKTLPGYMPVNQFIQFIRENNPEAIFRIETCDHGFNHSWYDSKDKNLCKFYSDSPSVVLTIWLSGKILKMIRNPPHYFVNLEIAGKFDSQIEERIKSLIDA